MIQKQFGRLKKILQIIGYKFYSPFEITDKNEGSWKQFFKRFLSKLLNMSFQANSYIRFATFIYIFVVHMKIKRYNLFSYKITSQCFDL
jgi:hypothetical protein